MDSKRSRKTLASLLNQYIRRFSCLCDPHINQPDPRLFWGLWIFSALPSYQLHIIHTNCRFSIAILDISRSWSGEHTVTLQSRTYIARCIWQRQQDSNLTADGLAWLLFSRLAPWTPVQPCSRSFLSFFRLIKHTDEHVCMLCDLLLFFVFLWRFCFQLQRVDSPWSG